MSDAPRPHVADADADAWVGLSLSLGACTMGFAALVFVWAFLRLSAPVWPPAGAAPLPRVLPLANAGLLVLASAALGVRSWSLSARVVTASVVSALFLLGECLLGASLPQLGWMRGEAAALGGTVALALGLHAVEVLIGVGGLAFAATEPDLFRRAARVQRGSMHFHFSSVVAVVLLGLFFRA